MTKNYNMKDKIFKDNLHTAEKIEAARRAREQQINKGISYGSAPSIGSYIEKAVQTQALDVNGGGMQEISPELAEFKQRLNNATETQIDLYLQGIQKQLIYRPNDETYLLMRSILLGKKNELRNGDKATKQALSDARKVKSILLSPEDIISGSKARDKAVDKIANTLKDEFGELEADLKDGVHRGGKMQTYKNATLTFGRESMTTPLVVNIPSGFSNHDIQAIKTRATQMAKAFGMQMLYGERTTDIILWINPYVYYDEQGMWHDYAREKSLKKM